MAILQTKKQNSGGYNNTNNATFTSSVTAGSLLIGTVTAGEGDTIPTAPSGWTLIGSPFAVKGARKTWLYYIQNATGGTTSMDVTFGSGQYTDSTVILKEHSGVVTSGALDKTTGADGSGYVQTHSSGATAATTQADELVIVVGGADAGSPTWAAGSGYGNIDSQAGFDPYTSGAYADKIVSATGAQTGVLTTTSYVQGQAIVATFKLVAAAAPTSAPTELSADRGATEINIHWNDTTANGATSYKVKRATTSGGVYSTVGTPTTCNFKDTGLTNGTAYFYKVCATNATGDGPDTAFVTNTPEARPTDHGIEWYPYGSPPVGLAQTSVRNYMRTHYDNWVSYTFTRSATAQAGKGAWRVWAQDQDFSGSGDFNATASEGIGYGMFVTAYMSRWRNPKFDIRAKEYFDGFWRYYKYYKNVNGLMNWHISSTGTVAGSGGASDGDFDVAVALVLMDRIHGSAGTVNYKSEAITLINAIRDFEFLPANHATYPNLMLNGDQWGDATDRYMADYFSPAWFRLFKETTGDGRWDAIIKANYTLGVDYYYTNTSYGLVPDNNKRDGTAVAGESYKYGYNSVRRPWRLTPDYLWFGNMKAYNSMRRMGADIKSRSSGVVANTRAEPVLDWSSSAAYTNQAFYSGYAVATLTDATIADFAATVATYMDTNVPGESSYFVASIGMMALLVMSGEMVSLQNNELINSLALAGN